MFETCWSACLVFVLVHGLHMFIVICLSPGRRFVTSDKRQAIRHKLFNYALLLQERYHQTHHTSSNGVTEASSPDRFQSSSTRTDDDICLRVTVGSDGWSECKRYEWKRIMAFNSRKAVGPIRYITVLEYFRMFPRVVHVPVRGRYSMSDLKALASKNGARNYSHRRHRPNLGPRMYAYKQSNNNNV
jgi:hypothetical protein